jgi:hypothetical protein
LIKGQFEQPLILALDEHYRRMNYSTYLHAQLNISWSNIISDVDLLAIKGDKSVAIEVKSKKDVFTNAFSQLDKIAPFVDKCFIATDNEIMANKFRNMKREFGILYIDLTYKDITVKKRAKASNREFSLKHLGFLRKCCLQELATEWNIPSVQSKPYLALDLMRNAESSKLRKRMKEIVVYWKCLHRHPGLEHNIKGF